MAKDPTPLSIRIAACIGSSIAIVVTLFRLSIRIRQRKVWWDDFWATLAMMVIIVFMTGILIFTDKPGRHVRSVRIAGYYMVNNGFYGVIWCARASIFLTLVRMSFGRFRTFLKYCVGAVFVTWCVLVAQVFWTCETQPSWKDALVAQCMLGRQVAIAQLITDCIFDSLLIGSPIYLLWGMKQRKGLKIRLIAVFSSTVFTTAFSLAHAWAIIEDRGLLEFMLATIEVVVSLIVVSLTVLVSWIFSINDDSNDSDPNFLQMNTFVKERRRISRPLPLQATQRVRDIENQIHIHVKTDKVRDTPPELASQSTSRTDSDEDVNLKEKDVLTKRQLRDH
ncbi:hypothetical protein PM082_009869 [Marasmius tenuissimus]|nr:hypothetical protein PM082_009869 [Marasmius tenuissimus]